MSQCPPPPTPPPTPLQPLWRTCRGSDWLRPAPALLRCTGAPTAIRLRKPRNTILSAIQLYHLPTAFIVHASIGFQTNTKESFRTNSEYQIKVLRSDQRQSVTVSALPNYLVLLQLLTTKPWAGMHMDLTGSTASSKDGRDIVHHRPRGDRLGGIIPIRIHISAKVHPCSQYGACLKVRSP